MKVAALAKEVEGVYRDMGNLENSKLDRQTATNQYKDLMNSYNHLYTQISLKENQIVTIENFVEKYLPMKILN